MNLNDVGIGVDIENVKRFEKYSKDKDDAFVKRVYSENEIKYCFKSKNPAKHLAVRFCAKEAVYKALCSVGVLDLGFKDIEIVHNKNKVPQVIFLNDKYKNCKCKLSLSHSRESAIASAIIVKENN